MKMQHETKLKILKSKLLTIVAGEGGLDRDHAELTLDDLIKRVSELYMQAKRHVHAPGAAKASY